MSKVALQWNDYRYFPYERMLGRLEVEALFGAKPEERDGLLEVDGPANAAVLAQRLTYFKGMVTAHGTTVPDQVKLEASGNGNGSSWDPRHEPVPSLRRQVTRYSAHGLHEYRGKFNPQVVRAVGNLVQLQPKQWVLDPFCGSGTTLLEAAHIGWNAVGMDINPLGAAIANSKLSLFRTSGDLLLRESEALAERLGHPAVGADWRKNLPEPEYLEKWFPEKVLRQLRAILLAVDGVRPRYLQGVFKVILSDICRDVSLQDPGDLRIRRRKDAADNYPAIEMFLSALQTKTRSVVRSRMHVRPKRGTRQQALVSDIRNASGPLLDFLARYDQRTFDAAITSPPYATAMPYLDTQRLSLVLLGLIAAGDLYQDEKKLIGSREIREKERIGLESELQKNNAKLPEGVSSFCQEILRLADDDQHGFRRRNVPALAYKYFVDMAQMFSVVKRVIRKKGHYALLVGRNATTLRGNRIEIDTPQLLAEVAESRGWAVENMLSFETYQRYDVHQNNSIREEVLLVLKNR